MAALFGLLGYVFVKLGCEPAPLLLGFVLGPADGGEPAPRHGDLRAATRSIFFSGRSRSA